MTEHGPQGLFDDDPQQCGPNVDDLVAEYLDRLNSGQRLDPFAIISEHPEDGPKILDKLETFVDLGSEDQPEAPLGTLGDYTLRRQIGRGGMGVVYEAWENSMDRAVALKVLPTGAAADEKAFHRFMREARTAGVLSHPSVVPVYGVGIKERTPYYAMELVQGETLAQVLTRVKDAEPEAETPFGPKDSAAYFDKLGRAFADVADGLQHAHSKGVTHRDIKPSNLILDPEADREARAKGRLRILDFGLARLEGQESLTLSGDFVGTPLYMSPEQARRRKIPVDHRTDVYSLGATMYEAICGRPPFRGKDHADTLSQIIERDPTEPRKANPRVPKDLETIVLKCLRKDSGDRYGTAEALGQDLRRFVRGDAIEARARPRWESWGRRVRIHKWRWITAAVFAALLILVSWLGHLQIEESRRAVASRYEEGTRRAAMVAHLGKLAGGDGSGLIHPIPFFGPEDLTTISSAEINPSRAMVEELEELETLLPSRFEAPYYRARLLHSLGRDEEARAALRRSLALRPGFAPAEIVLARLDGVELPESTASSDGWSRHWISAHEAKTAGRLDDAALSYQELRRIEERDGELYLGSSTELQLGHGVALLEAGDAFGASLDFAIAADRWPTFREPWLLLAAACFRSQQPERAQKVFERFYERSQAKDEAAYWIVATAHVLGDYAGAIRWAESITRVALREQVKSALLVFSYRFDDAMESARLAVEAAPDDALSHLLLSISLCYSSGQLGSEDAKRLRRKARRAAEQAVKLRPASSVARAVLGYALQVNKERDAANREVRKALALEPDGFPAQFIAGEVALNQGRGAVAERHFRRAAEISSGRGLKHEEALARRQFALVLRDKAPRVAFEECRRALAVYPDSRSTGLMGDLLSWWLGEHELAVDFYRRAVDASPVEPLNWSRLAEALYNLGKYDEARRAIDEALERSKGFHESLWMQGMIQLATGNASAAVASHAEAVLQRPKSGFARRQLAAVLLRQPAPDGEPRLDPLAAAVDDAFTNLGDRRDSARALLLLHSRAERDLELAYELARRGAESLEGKRPPYGGDGDFAYRVGALAMVEHARGERARAVRTLERALFDARAPRHLDEVLESWRQELAGAAVSYATVEELRADELSTLVSVESSGSNVSSPAESVSESEERVALFALALDHERKGRAAQAEVCYRRLVDLDADLASSKPRLGVFRSLVLQKKAREAEKYLREWLLSARIEEPHPWESWLSLCFIELSLTPSELLVRLSVQQPAGEDGASGKPRYLRDLLWCLEEFARAEGRGEGRGKPLRITCASKSDRFFVGGRSARGPGSTDASIEELRYARVRVFGPNFTSRPSQIDGAYRIPVPPGRYRVTLWLSALDCDSGRAAQRIRIESQMPQRCEPVDLEIDLVRACQQSAEVTVRDGILAVEFLAGVPALHIAALEIEALEAPEGAPRRAR